MSSVICINQPFFITYSCSGAFCARSYRHSAILSYFLMFWSFLILKMFINHSSDRITITYSQLYSLSCNITIWTPAFIFYQDVAHKYVLWKTLIQGFTLCSDGLWNPGCSTYDFYEKKLRFPSHIRANVRRHAVWDSRCVRGISIKHLWILKPKTNFANVDTQESSLGTLHCQPCAVIDPF